MTRNSYMYTLGKLLSFVQGAVMAHFQRIATYKCRMQLQVVQPRPCMAKGMISKVTRRELARRGLNV